MTSAFIKQASVLPAIGSFLAGTTILGKAQQAYIDNVVNKKRPMDAELYEKVRAAAENDGVKVLTNNKVPSSGYYPGKKMISMRDDQKYPGILAHELGHHRSGKAIWGSFLPGQLLSMFLPLLGRNAGRSKKLALGSTAYYMPNVASETIASKKGHDLLRDLGAKPEEQRQAFVGLPTYLLQALLPLTLYKGKKILGGYRPHSASTIRMPGGTVV